MYSPAEEVATAGGEDVGAEPTLVSVAVTGQTVVYRDIISVVTWPAGQFVTVGAQDVTV